MVVLSAVKSAEATSITFTFTVFVSLLVPLVTKSVIAKFPAREYVMVGFSSVEVDGVAPSNDQKHDVAF